MKNADTTKTILLPSSIAQKIEKMILNYPTLSFNSIVIEALELWLRQSDQMKPEKDRNSFIIDSSEGFGPRAKG